MSVTLGEKVGGSSLSSFFSAISVNPPPSMLPAPLQRFDANLLDQRLGVPIVSSTAPVAPATNWNLYIGLGLGALALLGLVVMRRRA